MRLLLGILPLLVLATTATGQPLIAVDGSATDSMYGGNEIIVQDNQTGFGDAGLGRPDICDGSELDGAYAVVYYDAGLDANMLALCFSGNYETNGNKLELFFDTRTGGQNQLSASNPDRGGLLRMGPGTEGPGLKFDSGFEADFYISVNALGAPVVVYVDYAELYVDEINPGVGYFIGADATKCETNGGELAGGDEGAPVMWCTLDNSNVAGVTGGFGADNGNGVLTGFELVLPLAAIGDPAGAFNVCAFINGQNFGFVSNQILGGLGGFNPDNLGEPRLVDFSAEFGNQFFTVPAIIDPLGACCVGQVCSIKTEAACTGTWLGANTNCDGNPCDTIPAGRCCIDDGYDGECLILTQAECEAEAGYVSWEEGLTCDDCPCLLPPQGACCLDDTCVIAREEYCITPEPEGLGGDYVGDFTNCDDAPCAYGACCDGPNCTDTRRFECAGDRFFEGVTCAEDPCSEPSITTPHVAGDWDWDPPHDPMVETAPDSKVWELTYTEFDPLSRHEFKITDGTWDNHLPSAGNSWFFADENGDILITYDGNFYADGWAPDRDRLPLPAYSDPGTWTATGSFQDGLVGDGTGDWNNADPLTAMVDQGSNIYMYQGTGLEVGTYYWKAVITGSWDGCSWDARSVNSANMEFVTTTTTDVVKLYVDALTGVVKVEVIEGRPCKATGDCDCNDLVNTFDIDPFVLALTGGQVAWEAAYTCDFICACDCDGNGLVNTFDIDPFVAILTAK